MTTVFWDTNRELMVDYREHRTKKTSEIYCETQKDRVEPFRTQGMGY
jgi:hypothetical protein